MHRRSAGGAALSDFPDIPRREFLAGATALLVSGCGGGGSGTATAPVSVVPPTPAPVPTPTPSPATVAAATISPESFYSADHGDNWQPALKAAFRAGAAENKDVVLDRATYNCRQVPQPSYYPYHDFPDFALFSVDGSLRIRSSRSTGSRIVRLAGDGSAFKPSDYRDTPEGYRARGGGLIMASTSTTPGEDPALRSFTCHGVLFDGSLRRDMGLTFHPEILDKGLWQHNDRNGGHITLTGTATAPCGFIGWGGEQLYTAAISGAEAARRVLSIDEHCVFGDTGGSALNPNGVTTRVGRCLLRDSFIGVEGWTGADGGFFNARLRDCAQSSIQAGVFNADPSLGNYYRYTSPGASRALGRLDVMLERANGFAIGSGMRGRVEAVDCCPSIGTSIVFQQGVRDVDLDLVSTADGLPLDPGMFLTGGLAGSQATDDVTVRLAIRRTAAAAARGIGHVRGSGSYGSFGPNVTIRIVESYLDPARDWGEYAPIHDNRPRIVRG